MPDPVAAPSTEVPTQPNPAADVPPVVTPFYLDKGLWVALLAPLLLLLNQKFGLTLDAAALVGFVLPAVAYILGHKWKTGTIQAAQVAAVTPAQAVAAINGSK